MQVAKVWCNNFMNFRNFTADLEKFKVTLITEDETGAGKDVLVTAIQFITSPYYKFNSVASALCFASPHPDAPGFVKLKLKAYDQEESQSYVTVTRTFTHLDFVSVETNTLPVAILPVEEFQQKYKTHVTYMYPYLEFDVCTTFSELNLFSFLSYERFSSTHKNLEKINSWLTDAGYQISDNITSDHFKSIVENLYQLSVFERIHHIKKFMKLSAITNIIFNKITDEKYSMRNVIATEEGVRTLALKDIENELPKDIITIIKTDSDEVLWNNTPPIIKLLLKISVEIAFAYHFDVPIIFLKNTEELVHHQTMQFISSELSEDSNYPASKEQDKVHTNYLQNMINTCEAMGLQVIIECDGFVKAENCNLLLCKELSCMQIDNVPKSSVENILKDLEEFI